MNTSNTNLSFENTEIAFQSKSDKELKKANFLFGMMGKPWLVRLGVSMTPLLVRWNLPFVKPLIRSSIFSQFVGGETLEQTAVVAKKLAASNVEVILDYGVEGGGDGEEGYDYATEEFIKVIRYAATQPNIPFMSIKVTGFARFGLLELIDDAMEKEPGTLMKKYLTAIEKLNAKEKDEWHKVRTRLLHICEVAKEKNIGVLVDAEETWIQDPVDALTILMMDCFNKGKCVVYNTVQLYRHDRLQFLKDSHDAAVERNFILGAKIVRGAYMEKEAKRAEENGYTNPIQANKENTDKDYDAAIAFCLDRIEQIALIVASHNDKSNLLAAQIIKEKGMDMRHQHIHFSQLYGMSDNITYNLANAGISVSKYLPFGPIQDVVPYLMRRAQENSSMAGQTGRELGLIKKELKRRLK